MATLRNIKRRIVSVKSTQQITKAMKMVAAAKLRKAQIRLISARPYAYEMEQVLGHIAARSKKEPVALLQTRKIKRVCYVIVTADRGLCGSFNANLIRRGVQEFESCQVEKKIIFAVGRKGYEFFSRRSYPVKVHKIDLFNSLDFSHAQQISARLAQLYQKKLVDQIVVVYNEFKSAMQQKIIVEQFLPIKPVATSTDKFPVGFIFEPNPEAILRRLAPLNLNIQMWRILLESSASELGARMTAMETASENAEDMIKELVLYYNKARQASITKELNEIVSGANALRG
jgi:F-type H+-transporting ATPase subunit gamma